jgi:2-hydroxy-3-keto-5-methylthiopentenyl-1-phosphate phosphatase
MDIQIFCDFDGTITTQDTLGRFLTEFAPPEWLELERRWINGEFGSKVCLTEQLRLIPKPDAATLNAFLNSIQIDPDFVEFYNFLKEKKVDFYVVSDGLDFFIKTILKKYSLNDIKFFSNVLMPDFTSEFPNYNESCKRQAGTCKCGVIDKLIDTQKTLIYIGDGISDFCAAQRADIIFAKRTLLSYCRENNFRNVIEFKTFTDIKEILCSKQNICCQTPK